MKNKDWHKSGLDNISPDFFDASSKLCQTMPKTKFGPYSRNNRFKRQNEVCRLHFEYGYSARKIAEVMNVNRNTVNQDLKQMHRNLARDWENFDVGAMILKHYYRHESHRTRLREKLDKTQDESERLILEKLIMKMDYTMPLLLSKIHNSHERMFENLIRYWNIYAEKNGLSLGLVASREITKVSKPTRDKIRKLIAEDRKQFAK